MADCNVGVPDKDMSGDNLYGTFWIPQANVQEFVDWFWYNYQFDYDWWQDGWGYDDCTNTDKPLARTFNGLYCLNYSSADPSNEDYGNDNCLYWGGRYVRERVFPLRATCGDGSKNATTFGAGCTAWGTQVEWACTNYEDDGYSACSSFDRTCVSWLPWPLSYICNAFDAVCVAWVWISSRVCNAFGWVTSSVCSAGNDVFGDKRIELYVPFFGYTGVGNSDYHAVPLRAATLFHECRHIDGLSHDAEFPAGSAMAGRDGADSSWDYGGAWQWNAAWLSWYYVEGQNTTDPLRERAKDAFNFICRNCFVTDPGFAY